ncbi:hypothetical protein ACF1FE_26360 [Streptomyces griseofuscus]|uniref:hypothetical protein n=1 Tax=Streptomyces griseofuscus TaxID=146922 RepID=UPI0036FAADE0
MGEGERETWTTEEFGSSHAGAVGVLLADDTVPAPVVFLNSSGSDSRSVSEWTIYDGEPHGGPRAAALRGVCSCAWTGPGHTIDWDEIADREAEVAGGGLASACYGDWDTHIGEVARSAVPVPETITGLLDQLEQEIEKLGKDAPLAAVRAVRRLEVLAAQCAYWPAREVAQDLTPEQAAAALGLNEEEACRHLARLGCFSLYC